jgi:TonB-dependent receptor
MNVGLQRADATSSWEEPMKLRNEMIVSRLGLAVAMLAGVSPALAQTASTESGTPNAEAPMIVVSGLRASLANSEAIKKRADGVIDVITAADIGKFPDTNLAEAIQRVPGVTIDRDNNEGSKITVRGFGPEYNLVTLNGRSMPGIILGNSASASRSFNFEELSADAINGVSVSKTGRADVPSGGIGATVDVTTARPFDYNGFKASFQAKAIEDTSHRGGVPRQRLWHRFEVVN